MNKIDEFHKEIEEIVHKYSAKHKLSYIFRSNSTNERIDRFSLEVYK